MVTRDLDSLDFLFKNSFLYAESDPDSFLRGARRTAEAILCLIHKETIGPIETKAPTIETLKCQLRQVIPNRIKLYVQVLQQLGNEVSHFNEREFAPATFEMAKHGQFALCNLAAWFFNDFLEAEPPDGLRAILNRSSLVDGKYNATPLKEEIVKHPFSDQLRRPSDVSSFGEYGELYFQYLEYLVGIKEGLPEHVDPTFAPALIGCWHGWYTQYGQQTYFDMLILLGPESTIIGRCIEPINPTWKGDYGDQKLLDAKMTGKLALEDIGVASWQKVYNMEKFWPINYLGTVLESNHELEGTWHVREKFGSFSAVRCKAYLPVRILSMTSSEPIVSTIFDLGVNPLDGIWVCRVVAANQFPFKIAIVMTQPKKRVVANLIEFVGDRIRVVYAEGGFDDYGRLQLSESCTIYPTQEDCQPLVYQLSHNPRTDSLMGTVIGESSRGSIKAYKSS